MFDPEIAVVEILTSGRLKVPPYPAVALRLNTLLANSDFSMTEVIEVLGADPALAARVIGCANSAALRGSGREINSLSEAVSRIGAKQLAQVALASGVADSACQGGPLQEIKFLVWRHSLCCGFVAQELAPHRSLASDQAFLIGLLQGFGSTVVLGALEEVCAQNPGQALKSQSGWLQLVARRQAAAGVYLAKQWELPAAIAAELNVKPSAELSPIQQLVATARQVVSLMEQRASVTDADLAPLVRDLAERQALLKLLPELPGIVNELAGSSPGRAGKADKLILKSSSVRQVAVELGLTVLVQQAKKTLEYQGAIVDRNTLILRGQQPLQENWLAKLALQAEPPLELWMRVTRTVPDGDGYAMDAQPFALNGDVQTRWATLVAKLVAP